jgi:hypothetical protein
MINESIPAFKFTSQQSFETIGPFSDGSKLPVRVIVWDEHVASEQEAIEYALTLRLRANS